ncbi:MAG: hypothetical protein U0O09_01200 [Phascolarctobacterium sp.]
MSNIIFGSCLYGSFVWGAGSKKKTTSGGGTGGGGTGGGGTAGSITYILMLFKLYFSAGTAQRPPYFPTAQKIIRSRSCSLSLQKMAAEAARLRLSSSQRLRKSCMANV